MAMIVPLPHCENNFEVGKKTCVGVQNCVARAAVARYFGNSTPPPPLSKHPGAASVRIVQVCTLTKLVIHVNLANVHTNITIKRVNNNYDIMACNGRKLECRLALQNENFLLVLIFVCALLLLFFLGG